MRSAFALALANAGKSIAARIAMIAITTSNSINVKPQILGLCLDSVRSYGRFADDFVTLFFAIMQYNVRYSSTRSAIAKQLATWLDVWPRPLSSQSLRRQPR